MGWMEIWLIYKERRRNSDKKVGSGAFYGRSKPGGGRRTAGLERNDSAKGPSGRAASLGGYLIPAFWSSVACLGLQDGAARIPYLHRQLYYQVLAQTPWGLRLIPVVEHLESMMLL